MTEQEKKAALFVFDGELMQFSHALLNAFDLHEKGWKVQIVIEGAATKLIKEFHDNPNMPFAARFFTAVKMGLVCCACQACSQKMGVVAEAAAEGIPHSGRVGQPHWRD